LVASRVGLTVVLMAVETAGSLENQSAVRKVVLLAEHWDMTLAAWMVAYSVGQLAEHWVVTTAVCSVDSLVVSSEKQRAGW